MLADALFTLSMLALFTAISVLSYHLFEIHFLRLKSRFAPLSADPATAENTGINSTAPAREFT
jgi:peptidoglycan/LPS O-acetylase OafA/YrhL